jgi:Ca-activated chloride channel family protein
MGEPYVITKPDEAPAKAERFRTMIQSPVLTGVKANFNGFAAYDVEPVRIPDVLAERPVIVFGKWRGKPQGKITLTGMTGEGKYTDTIDVAGIKPSRTNSALRYLWARHRVTLLSDYNKLRSDDKRIKEVTDLGLTYNLLTAYTSFVAIDTEVRNTDGMPTTVKQPLPLPQSVSDFAVGGMASTRAYAPMAKLASPAEFERKGILREQIVSKDAPKQKSSPTIGEVTASGGLPKEAVAKIVNDHIKEIDACRSQTGLEGKVTVTLTIGADGVVKDIKVVSGSTKNKTADQCIVKLMKKWQFPANNPGKETKVTITLLF